MKKVLLIVYKIIFVQLPTFINCFRSGLKFNRTWSVVGRPVVIRRRWYERLFANHTGGGISIGEGFHCNNQVNSNSIGLIQPCVFNVAIDNSRIKIGNNVGISGSTINAAKCIIIEDNVLIGSGCIITDTDSHPINYDDRITDDMSKTNVSPVVIKEGAFLGARCMILKGVTVGRHSVIGAGSVVTKDIPDYTVACGNPAVVIKSWVE